MKTRFPNQFDKLRACSQLDWGDGNFVVPDVSPGFLRFADKLN